MNNNYIDPAKFNELFTDAQINWNSICLDIQKMVDGLARLQKFLSPEEEEDIKSAVLVHTLSKVKCFVVGNSAFSYFTGIIINQYKSEFTKKAQKKRLHLNYLKQHVSLEELYAMREIEIPRAKIRKKPVPKPKPARIIDPDPFA